MLAILLVVAGIAGLIILLGRALDCACCGAAGGVSLAPAWRGPREPGKRFFAFTQESVAETKKVVWPSRKETMQTTGLVVAFVVVMALFLWVVDALLGVGVQMLMGRGA